MPDFTLFAQQVAVWALPVLLAITVHEAAHGYAARGLGDDTASRAGRLSLNPIRHVDPIGTVLLPVVLLATHGWFLFGWAKPVPVDFRRLRPSATGAALVAAAGPASNLLMAVGWAALLLGYQAAGHPPGGWTVVRDLGIAGVSINLVLMVANALPIPPLDAGRLAVRLLPRKLALPLSRVEPYGLTIVVLLIAAGVLGTILFWPLAFAEIGLYTFFGINLVAP